MILCPEDPITKQMRGLTRRSFLRGFLGGFFFPFLPVSLSKALANSLSPFRSYLSLSANPDRGRDMQALRREEKVERSREEKGSSIAEFFIGEDLGYEIGFWLFKRAALGRLSFRQTEKKGQYLAILKAETLGVLGWVSRYRVDTYRSTMEEIGGGSRLRSLSFEEDVKIGNKVRKRVTQFDYEKRKWVTLKERKDGTTQRIEEEIPPGKIYDDFLTAAYNFRYGVYGEIERGKTYTVPTFPRKGASSYEVRVAPKEEEEKRRHSEKVKDQREYFVKLILDPEITHSKEGRIEGWLSKELFPMEGTIKDVLLFGDVRGTLVKNNRT
jgi:Protein of unknown function (DUF3108)